MFEISKDTATLNGEEMEKPLLGSRVYEKLRALLQHLQRPANVLHRVEASAHVYMCAHVCMVWPLSCAEDRASVF